MEHFDNNMSEQEWLRYVASGIVAALDIRDTKIDTVTTILKMAKLRPEDVVKREAASSAPQVAVILQQVINAIYNPDGSFKCMPLEGIRQVASMYGISMHAYQENKETSATDSDSTQTDKSTESVETPEKSSENND